MPFMIAIPWILTGLGIGAYAAEKVNDTVDAMNPLSQKNSSPTRDLAVAAVIAIGGYIAYKKFLK